MPPVMTADAIAEKLAALVDIPSVTGNEAAIAAFVENRLRERGTGEVTRSGNGVLWRAPARGRPLVTLVGHLDTVPPQGNERSRREGDRLYGLGTSDMKAGVAVMQALVESLDPEALRFDLACVFYDAEEGPATGNGLGRMLPENPWLKDAAAAIVLEPTDLNVEMGCNGILNVEVRVPGVSAHSARPWLGRNAVGEGAAWLSEIVRYPVTPVEIQGLEYRRTLQVTTVRAGRARNVVPDEMVVNLNHRFTPDTTIEQATAALRRLVPETFGFEVVDAAAPGRVALDQPVVSEFVRRAGAKVAGKQGWTDVARFSAAGIPAFNYGPGLAELCHRADEHCPIANLGVAFDTLARFLARED
ncbi:MAG: succinyl-diaminopimelate desuccinylase [Candidatus Eisenbacteria bacterium]|nr:succinyl-diaminopimelate desuccinylase [Candidatus Eisenbacteria bacterium]